MYDQCMACNDEAPLGTSEATDPVCKEMPFRLWCILAVSEEDKTERLRLAAVQEDR